MYNLKMKRDHAMNATRLTFTLTTALLLSAAPAWAINKCSGPGGKVVSQDAPCAGQGGEIMVKPATGNPAPSAPQAVAEGQRPMTEAQRINANTDKIQQEWHKRDLERRKSDLEAAIAQDNTACEREQDQLRSRKAAANNNLAGATWEQSISLEMQAAAARCDTRSRQRQHDLDEVNKNLAAGSK
jgi:hypothetical protein